MDILKPPARQDLASTDKTALHYPPQKAGSTKEFILYIEKTAKIFIAFFNEKVLISGFG
jgi:hypothetical protein